MGWGLGSLGGPRGLWALMEATYELLRGGWLPGCPALPRVSGVGKQLPAEHILTCYPSAALSQSVPAPGRPGPLPPWRVPCSC